MFKEFKDVKARDEVKQEESALEKLITLGDEILNDPEIKNLDIWYDSSIIRNNIDDKLKTINYEYNENDIVSLIRFNNLGDYASKDVFGTYTGCLLTKLTKKRHAENKTTNIVVDGIKQDYILGYTKKADSILINNCESDKIGVYIGSDNGHIGQVIINNCKGEILGSNIGHLKGDVKQVIINNCKGNYIGNDIGSIGGYVEQVIFNNCKGNVIGYLIGAYGGEINQVIINNCKGNDMGEGICYMGGKVEQVILNNCKGHEIGYQLDKWNIDVNQKIINNPAEIKKQGLTELIRLVDSLTGKSASEVQEIAKKIGEYSNV